MSEKLRFIHRAARDEQHPYFMMRRATAQDINITFEARGVLAYILSKPDDWRVQAKDLEQNCGKSVVYRVLSELIRHGYIKRLPMRNEKKQIVSWDYSVYEEPLPKNQEVAIQEIASNELLPKKLEVGKQELENQHYTEYREEQNTEITKPKARAGARGVGKVSKSEYIRRDKLAKYDALIRILLRKFKPDVDLSMVRPCDLYPKEIDRYIEAAEILEGFGLSEADLPGMFKYLDAKGWPSYGIGKIAEYAPDYNGIKARRGAAEKIIQDNPALDLSTPIEVIPILMQREKIAPASELEDAS